MAFPLIKNSIPKLLDLSESDPRDIIFSAHYNPRCGRVSSAYVVFLFFSSLSSNLRGCACHPIYDNKAMAPALRHAVYSGIINAEATAISMFLPASGKLVTTNPYSKLLTAYVHL
eukprot:1150115-Pelagomonas_calceolata.AAC.1